MRRELLYLLGIVAIAFGVRVYAPWSAVFEADRVNFLETDAWYHVRLIEHQVRNWPWRVTVDPYAAPGGQFVPIAPLFDTVTATVAVVLHGRDAETRSIERVAALVPPVLGTLAVIAVWALGRSVFDTLAGLLGAALLAILPGHFLDRSLLGFYDHHVLEALLAVTLLWALSGVAREKGDSPLFPKARGKKGTVPFVAGLVLGLYLLAWGSGAFLIGILGLWLLLLVPLVRSAEELSATTRVLGISALVALILVILFQDARMHRYGSQILGLIALAGMSLTVGVVAGRRAMPRKAITCAVILLAGGLATSIVWVFAPGLFTQVMIDLGRLTPDPKRMAVLEARPLFLYPGQWHWLQPWEFFRTGFYVGVLALVFFSVRVWRTRRPIDLLLWVFTLTTFGATIGQNRFAYYLVPACAVLGGWLAGCILDWAEVPHAITESPNRATTQSPTGAIAQSPKRAIAQSRNRPIQSPNHPITRSPNGTFPLQRELAVIIVAAGMFAPNLVPAALVASRTGSLPAYWHDAMIWLRTGTPPPFLTAAGAGDEYYLARYPYDSVPLPDYTVMNWWDHGYWVVQIARRVPISNPTQERAPNAARFYAATSEADAAALLDAERVRYVLADWELPFRLTPQRTMMGRFQNVVDWAGAEHAKYYEVYYRRENDAWTPVWVFHEPYYQSMAYRLMVMGGAPAQPADATSVLVVADRADKSGLRFREIVSATTHATFEAAREAARTRTAAGAAVIAGLDPWRPAFPLDGLTMVRQVHESRTPEQKPGEAPWVRVFEVGPRSARPSTGSGRP